MNFLSELVAAYQTDHLKLPAVLDALTARGALDEAQYRAELEWLEQLRAAGGIEPIVVRALLAKLSAVQMLPAAMVVNNPDVTVVKPATQRLAMPPVAPGGSDVTLVQPTSRPPATPEPSGDQVTIVKPASGLPLPALDGPTVGSSQQRMTGTGTGVGSSQSSWQHIGEAEGGDFAAVGSLLKGRFHLEKEIGRGGMGVVFLARDERKVEARDRDPYVAVKVLNDEFRRHPDSLIALQRESRRSQSLAHDNIVRVFDFDKDGTIVFMTMEYIDGSDLKQLIRERAYNGMPLEKARPLIEGMAWALKRAHASGVVHSDFKPGNVMVTREGVPKVFDFGIARAGKHMGDQVGEQTVFDAGTLGALTPAYASLEMIQGKEPTPSDDIYALGCVVFELLTGKHPFDKVSADVAMKEGRKPPPVPGLTKHQYKALCASVAFTSEQRLKSAQELVEGLREIGLRERMRPYLIYGIPAALVLAGGAWGWITYRHNQDVAQVFARFAMNRPDHYENENQALKALDSLNKDDRKHIVTDQSAPIQNFLLSRIDAYWNPGKARYDYAKAQQIFKLRDDLKLYSPALDIRRSAVEGQKNDLLNALDTQLTRQIGADAIFGNQPDNVVATLSRIRAIDPGSALLRNAELELKYDTAIGKSLDAGQVDVAMQQFKLASGLFPDSTRLKQRGEQLDALGKTVAAQQLQQQQTQQLQQQREQSLRTLAGLLDRASNTDDWRNQVVAAYRRAASLLGDDPRLAVQTTRLKQLLAAQSTARQSAGDLVNAITLAQKKSSQQQVDSLAGARATLAGLSAKPVFTPDWQAAVANAMQTLHDDTSPETLRVVNGLAIAIATDASRLDDPQHVAQAGSEVDFGLRYVPKSPQLLAQKVRLEAVQQALQSQLARENTDAEVKSRMESVRSAAAADDVDKASQSLARIRILQPDNPFLTTDGPKLLADAYLGLARDNFQRGNYQKASDVLGQGLGVLQGNTVLDHARARYDLVIGILKAGKQPLSAAAYAQLVKQLDAARSADAAALNRLEADMRIRGQLPAGSLAAQLEGLNPNGASAQSHDAAFNLVRKGEHDYARQDYSSAIANARAALKAKPGYQRAEQLLKLAQRAQQRAMNSISIQ